MRNYFSPRIWLVIILALGVALFTSGCGRRTVTAPVSKSSELVSNIQPEIKKDAQTENKAASNNANKPDPKKIDVPHLEFTQQGVTLNWDDKGQRRMSASASTLSGDEITRKGELINFSAKLYQDGHLSSSMSAPKVIADSTNRVVTATGGVVIKSLDRDTVIKAPWIKWYAKQQKVVGGGGVQIISKFNGTTLTTRGAAFVADTALKTFTVKDSGKGIDL